SAYLALIIPLIGKATARLQEQAQQRWEAQQRAELQDLATAEKEAKTAGKKAEIDAKRKEGQSRTKPTHPSAMGLSQTGSDDPKIQALGLVDFATGFVLNLLLLASGVALVRRRTWGLRLGIGVAFAKIIRLVLLYGYSALVIVPEASLKMAKL